jgi:hypothetical protein
MVSPELFNGLFAEVVGNLMETTRDAHARVISGLCFRLHDHYE